jgi:nicotinamidase-related amidase
MTPDELFERMDLNHDGNLSRSELHTAATRMGWHWNEAPFFAVLDLLSLLEPLPRHAFIRCMNRMAEDPLGPYGKVLLRSPHFYHALAPARERRSRQTRRGVKMPTQGWQKGHGPDIPYDPLTPLLELTVGRDTAARYQGLLDTLDQEPVAMQDAALMIIDPQRSFTTGAWMRSMGPGGEREVGPIQVAFANCAQLLSRTHGSLETMFSRCPFPADSYDWDDHLAEVVDPAHPYFIKPGNSILFPPLNGFRQWVERGVCNGKKALVMGGCTLNSCVRVSSIETQQHFHEKGFRVVVDLSLCGARTSNHTGSPLYGGRSAVESAVGDMIAAGVHVVERVKWR